MKKITIAYIECIAAMMGWSTLICGERTRALYQYFYDLGASDAIVFYHANGEQPVDSKIFKKVIANSTYGKFCSPYNELSVVDQFAKENTELRKTIDDITTELQVEKDSTPEPFAHTTNFSRKTQRFAAQSMFIRRC